MCCSSSTWFRAPLPWHSIKCSREARSSRRHQSRIAAAGDSAASTAMCSAKVGAWLLLVAILLRLYRLPGDIGNTLKVPNTVPQMKYPAADVRMVLRPLLHDTPRNQTASQHGKIFLQEGPGQKSEIVLLQSANDAFSKINWRPLISCRTPSPSSAS